MVQPLSYYLVTKDRAICPLKRIGMDAHDWLVYILMVLAALWTVIAIAAVVYCVVFDKS